MKRIIAVILCLILLMGCLPAVSAATVTDISDKAGFAAIGNNLSGNYRLVNDIVFTEADFAEGGVMYGKLPFAVEDVPFSGTLDGNGHTVNGLIIDVDYYLDDTDTVTEEIGVNFAALFGLLSGSVKNLELKNIKLSFDANIDAVFNEMRVGAIAATMSRTAVIEQCAVSGSMVVNIVGNGRVNVGGLVGFSHGKITDSACYADITVARNTDIWTRVGGIVGKLDISAACVEFCYVNAAISVANSAGTANSRYGAFAGNNCGIIDSCYYADTLEATTGDSGAGAMVSDTDSINIADLGKADCYERFDFTDLWSIQTIRGVQQAGLQAFICEHSAPGAWTQTVAPSCYAVGKEVQNCALCGEVLNERDVPATNNHVWDTALTQGQYTHYYACTTLGCSAKNEENAHTAGEIIVDAAPTCGATGTGHKDCTVCGLTVEKDVTISATGAHIEDTENVVIDTPANCGDAGIAHTVCTVCGNTVNANVTVSPTGNHSWDGGVVTTEPTSSKKGVKTYTCTVCGETKTEDIPAKGVDVLSIFTDLKKKDWYVKNGAIDFVYNNGLFSGLTATTFGPNDNMTRGMFVTVLGRLHGVSVSKKVTTKFTDVKKNQYYTGYVKWASDNDIVAGLTTTTFGPDENVSREQICAMMVRYCNFANITLEKKNAAITFLDAAKISKYARSAVKACQQGGIVNGEKVAGGYNFRPQGNATRAEVATIMMNFAKSYK